MVKHTANVSSSLIWQLIRNNNSKLIRRNNRFGGSQFTKEKGNLLSKHSEKYSGLANNVAIDVRTAPHGIKVSFKRQRYINKPSSQWTSVKFRKPKKLATDHSIAGIAGIKRKTLEKDAIARWHRYYYNRKKLRVQAKLAAKGGKGKEKKGKGEKKVKDIDNIN